MDSLSSSDLSSSDGADRRAMLRTATRAAMLRRVRPTSVVSPLLRLMSKRRIVDVQGLRIFADPTSHLGGEILTTGTYEPETVQLFRAQIKPGDVVLDIGANEGFFAALAGQLAGPDGTVIAVEPQSRLRDVLEVNLALNARGRREIIARLVAEVDDELLAIALFPVSNTGASSVVRRYRFGAKTERVRTITPRTILDKAGVARADFVKIDVEGFEPEVVRALLPLAAAGRIGTLLVDYHSAILRERGVDWRETDVALIARGMRLVEGTPGDGYALYRSSGADEARRPDLS